VRREELTTYLDEYLRVREIDDSSLNGLQVDGPDQVDRVAFVVDARLAAFEEAARRHAQLIIAHHGLFWGKVEPVVGTLYRRLRALVQGDVGLYAVHLPLDAHPEVGNNAELARILDLKERTPAGEYHGERIGFGGVLAQPTDVTSLARRVEEETGYPVIRVVEGGRPAVRVACVAGGAAEMAAGFASCGYDTYVTGEVSHSFLPQIEELRMNVIFAGHYATECLGVKALARHLANRFDIETRFLAFPTEA